MKKKKPPVAQWVVLGLLFFAACAYQVRATIAAFPGFFDRGVAQWPFIPGYFHGEPTAAFVEPEAHNAGVREGDVVTNINGKPFTGLAVFGEAIAKAKPGDTLQVTVQTPGSNTERTTKIPLTTPRRTIHWTAAVVIVLKVVLPAFSILLGFWVALVRPRDISAWLLIGVLLGLCSFYTSGTESWGRGVRDLAEFYRMGCNGAWPFCMLFFGLYFPQPFPHNRAQGWVRLAKYVLAPVVIVDAVVSIAIRMGEMESFATVSRLSRFWERFGSVASWFGLIAIGSFFASILFKSGTAVSPDAKRRLRLLYVGTTVSLTPALILIVIAQIKSGEFEQIFPKWLVLVSLTLLLLFPITLAYVIVVQRALDVRVVVRQGLQYALATGGIRVLQVALTAGVLLLAINLTVSHGSLAQKVSVIAWGAFLVLMLRRAADYLRKWIDRRFFRDAYDAEQILEALGDEVRTIVEKRPLLERVATSIAESLHIPRVAVLLEDGGFYRPAFALGFAGALDVALPDSGATVDLLKQGAGPERVYFDDEDSWVNDAALSANERRNLASLQPQLLLPLMTKHNLLGIISLGEKRSEAPYSGTDLRLLRSVASQTALALSNAELTSAIAVEIGRREKLNREIEIAREVQERLFPQRLPGIAGLDYFGRCRTALGVGGDYYDFLALPDGKLGVALGDVSGKGIAAALLMANLQANLRSQSAIARDHPRRLLRSVNRLFFENTVDSAYASLLFAEYDDAARRLRYANCGHLSGLVLRADGTCQRLDSTGTLLGLFEEWDCSIGECDLFPGDLLALYTDGITEAYNDAGEEFGEQSLIDRLRQHRDLPCETALATITDEVRRFNSHEQHDDITLIIAKCKKRN